MAKSLAQASRKSIQQSKISQLDYLGEDKESFDEGTLGVIEMVAGNFVENVISNIENEDMIVSGKIADISVKSENGEVRVYANPWLLYQDKGVNGSKQKLYNTPYSYKDKMPPVSVFIDYIKTRNLQLRNNAQYHGPQSPYVHLTDDEQIESAAWGMARKVFEEGIKPRNIYTKEIPRLVEGLNEELTTFITNNIVQLISKDASKPIKINL